MNTVPPWEPVLQSRNAGVVGDEIGLQLQAKNLLLWGVDGYKVVPHSYLS